MMNKRKKTLVGKLEQKCEKAWSAAVLKRDPICRLCNQAKSVHPHHIVLRAQSLATKFDLDNGAGVCEACHRQSHLSPAAQTAAAYNLIGERDYLAMVERSREVIYSAGPTWFEAKLKEIKL